MSGVSKAALVLVAAGTSGTVIAGDCGGQWLRPVPGQSAFDNEITALVEYEGKLVVGGRFEQAPQGAARFAAAWDGANWTPMSFGTGFRPQAVTVYSGSLYSGSIYGGSSSWLAKRWNGSSWVDAWTDIPIPTDFQNSIATFDLYQGKLVVAGNLRVGSPKRNAVWLWDGVQWSNLGATFTKPVQGTEIYNGELYVWGDSPLINNDLSMGNLLRYDGATWRKVGDFGIDTSSSMAVRAYKDKLYIASGSVRNTGAFSYGPVASWDGTTVARVGVALSITGSVSVMSEYHGDLIIAGTFLNSFNVGANSIVRFDGSNFASFGSGITDSPTSNSRKINALAVYGDELVVGGTFLNAGGIASPYFARWTDNSTPWVAVDPIAQPVNEGLTLTLSAAAANGYVDVTYKWQRNGADIVDGAGGASSGGGIVTGASGATASPSTGASVLLTISGMQASDAGAYSVVFSNGCNDATSAAAVITVNTCPGDLNSDGVIDDSDFALFVGAYNVLVCEDASMAIGCPADLNGDGLVEDLDFQVFVVGYDALVCE